MNRNQSNRNDKAPTGEEGDAGAQGGQNLPAGGGSRSSQALTQRENCLPGVASPAPNNRSATTPGILDFPTDRSRFGHIERQGFTNFSRDDNFITPLDPRFLHKGVHFQGDQDTGHEAVNLVQEANPGCKIGGMVFPVGRHNMARTAAGLRKMTFVKKEMPAATRERIREHTEADRALREAAHRAELVAWDDDEVPPQQAQQQQHKVKCAGCGSDRHDLSRCLQAGKDGLMQGCPKCNTLSHSISDCQKIRGTAAKYYFMVVLRANMPAFQATESWVSIVREMQTPLKPGGKARRTPSRFPWTPAFTLKKAAEIPQLQKALDEGGFQKARLPADPDTKDWTAVRRTFGVPQIRPRPADPARTQAQVSGVGGGRQQRESKEDEDLIDYSDGDDV
ncbi:hypothetical protein FALBO_5362 [Fusarium albosuccineum]|uniref:Uncharacterized protein n=1 Tax=Fusarium albosuccineum TaxID=1237068 RepID=A0A8H4LE67_9HYPO|nr:hypothetical protein FALBO_5362 [Fusarium albosuccineum]